MKIAITSTGEGLEAEMDQRFGRAQRFVVIDVDTGELSSIDNVQNLQAPQGAGIQAAKTVIDQGAGVLITGHCGPNAFRTLQSAGVRVIVGATGTIGQVVENFKSGKLKYADNPDVSGHWS
jgi:predicted Fe-Mo cluster-binding NifX family protein